MFRHPQEKSRLMQPEKEEMSNLGMQRDSLRRSLRGVGQPSAADDTPVEGPPVLPENNDSVIQFRADNFKLRARVKELEQQLQNTGPSEEAWAERQREYEALLDEKSEVIRDLHLKLQELQESFAAHQEGVNVQVGGSLQGGGGPAAEELLELQRQLEEERRQLQGDEEALMTQAREMELSMSRERAELGRQRNELQRLQTELASHLEQAARDSGLRERLAPLQRRQQELSTPASGRPAPPQPQAPAASQQPSSANTPPPKKQSSGIFRHLFGGNENP